MDSRRTPDVPIKGYEQAIFDPLLHGGDVRFRAVAFRGNAVKLIYAQQLLPFGEPLHVNPVPVERVFLAMVRLSYKNSCWQWMMGARMASNEARKARQTGKTEDARMATRRCLLMRALSVWAFFGERERELEHAREWESHREMLRRQQAQGEGSTSR